ncbi:MAG: response regulator transcription factor [Anaerolineales bacterium]
MTNKVLVVDDDKTLLRFVSEYLKKEGFQVAIADRGQKALRQFYKERPEIVLLDVMMPGMDGWEVCARLKELADVPVILLTAKTAEADKLRGFRLGVDDYITKPFSMAELVARIQAVLARTQSDSEDDVLFAGVIAVDMLKREARIEDRVLDLTPTEFRLLAALARRSGEAVSQDDLIAEVWGEMRVKSGSALRRYIWLLRRKIEPDPEDPTRLVTVRGYGYRLEM